jgi:hypothetical protein
MAKAIVKRPFQIGQRPLPAKARREKPGEQRKRGGPVSPSPRALVVLGMHRSGTSALGGSVARLGVDFGDRLAPPAPDNEKGFWEHPEIVALHDKLLQELGSNWEDDSPLPPGWPRRKETRTIQASLATIVARDFHKKNLFGIKDPRLSRLVPLWLPIFEKLGITPYFVLMVRHPWEIAESLRKRNGIPPSKSVLLWLRYTLEAETTTRRFSRRIISYAQLLSNPGSTLAGISQDLDLPRRSSKAIARKVGNFLEQSLRHHRVSASRQKKARIIPSIALEIYEALIAASNTGSLPERMPGLVRQFKRSSTLFQPRFEDLLDAAARLRRQLDATSALLLQRQNENEEQTTRLVQFQSSAEERARHIAALQAENEEKTRQVFHFKGDAEERTRHIALLQAENEEKTKLLLHFKEDGEERAKHIALLQDENEVKTGQVFHFKSDAEERARHVALLQAEVEEKTKLLIHFKEDAEERAKHIALLQDENDLKTQQVFHFKSDAEERVRHIALLQAENDEKGKLLIHFKEDAEERAKHVALLLRENEEKTRQVIHFKSDVEEKTRHVALLLRENEEKTRQVIHFKSDAEEKAEQVLLLARENEQKIKQLIGFEKEAQKKARYLTRLESDLKKQSRQATYFKEDAEAKEGRILQLRTDLQTKLKDILTLQRESDEQRQLIERLNLQLARAEERLNRIKSQLADARWAVFTLRKELLQKIHSAKTSSALVLDLQNQVITAESERDQLRLMVRGLQRDVDQERYEVQQRETQYRAATERLEKTNKELRSQRKQMDHLRNRLTGKLILPFGKTQRKLQDLAAPRGENV